MLVGPNLAPGPIDRGHLIVSWALLLCLLTLEHQFWLLGRLSLDHVIPLATGILTPLSTLLIRPASHYININHILSFLSLLAPFLLLLPFPLNLPLHFLFLLCDLLFDNIVSGAAPLLGPRATFAATIHHIYIDLLFSRFSGFFFFLLLESQLLFFSLDGLLEKLGVLICFLF